MDERKRGGVKEGACHSQRLPRTAIAGVADHRVVYCRQVHPDLVGAPRLQPAREKARGLRPLVRRLDAVGGPCLPARGDDGHLGRIGPAPTDRSVYPPLRGAEMPPAESTVHPAHRTIGKLRLERIDRQRGAADNEEAGRALVEAVDYSWPEGGVARSDTMNEVARIIE